MKTKYMVYFTLWLFVAAVVLLYDSCYGPSINADQPQSADENSTFTTAVTVTQGSDESRGSQEVLTKLEIEIPEALMYNPSDTNWLFFGIMLPDGWSVADNIPFTGDATGIFAWSSSLSAEMEIINPADPDYHWWVSKNIDPITVSSGTIEFSPQITTNDDPGTYWLDYTIGYGADLWYNGDYNNILGVGLEDTVYVTSLSNTGPGSLRDAVDVVSPDGYILFDLAFPCCLTVSGEISLFKNVHIEGPGKNLLTVSTNFSGRLFSAGSGLEIHISGLSIANSGGPNIDGGAIYTSSSSTSLHMDDVLIQGCQADEGGAIRAQGPVFLDNVDIKYNTSNYGGGLYLTHTANLANCLVSGNVAGWGGGIYNTNSPLYLDNVDIDENTANGGGGGLYNFYGNVSLYDSRIALNNAENGGGIYHTNGFLELSGTNVTGNTAGEFGGGIHLVSGDVIFDDTDLCNIHCNEAFMGFDLFASDGFSSDPVQVIVDEFSVEHPNDYWAFPFSAFMFDIQSGIYPQYDMDLYVSPGGSDDNNGTSAAQPFKTLKRALSMLYSTSTGPNSIHLAPGTYSEASNGETFPLYLRSYVTLSGPGSENAMLNCGGEALFAPLSNQSSINIENISAGDARQMIETSGSNLTLTNISITGNYYPDINCIQVAGGTVNLNGIEITGYEKAIVMENSTVTLHDCAITGNNRGMEAAGTYLSIYNTEVTGNAPNGGIYLSSSNNARIYDSKISGNGADLGGGIYGCGSSTTRLYNVTIKNNDASEMGGGIFLDNSSLGTYRSSRSNIYGNNSPVGSDIASIDRPDTYTMYLDTFSVLYPNSYYAYPNNAYAFNILHGVELQYDQDLYVSPSGSDENTGTTPGDPLKTLCKSLKTIVAVSGPHTVFLEGGTYSTSSTGDHFPILLQDQVSFAGDPDSSTIIDAEGSSYVLDMAGIAGITVSDIQVTGGYNATTGVWGGEAGGIRLVDSDLTLERVILTDNRSFYGSGIFMEDAELDMQDCSIHSNISINNGCGGGMYIKGDCELVTDSLVIEDNHALHGAGIYLIGSNILLENIILKNNICSNEGSGGGIYIKNSDATLDALDLELNRARNGGALFVDQCNPVLQNLAIHNNTAFYKGGGIGINNGSPLLNNVSLENNRAYYFGGGMSVDNGSGPLVLESVISGNEVIFSSGIGGAVHSSASQPVFMYTGINGNTSESAAGMSIVNSVAVLTSVTLHGNVAEIDGGALLASEGSDVFLFECDLAENTAMGSGGAIHAEQGSHMHLSDCDLYGNYANLGGGIAFHNLSTASFDPVDRCDIHLNEAVSSGSDLYSNACEVIEVILDTFTVIHPIDYFAHRVENFEFDILNYILEQGAFDIYVSPEGSDDNSGTSPEEPLRTVNYAISKILVDTIPPHRIYLEPGVYSPGATGEQFPLNVRPNMELIGSGSGETVLDGDSLQIMTIGNVDKFLLSGVSLVNGYSAHGGAIWSSGCRIVFEDVEISNCSAYRGGAAYLLDGCMLELNNTLIHHNQAMYAAALYCKGNNYITGNNAVIEENTATSVGGGVYMHGCDGYLRNLRITHNESNFGAGIYMSESSPEISNVVVDNNTGSRGSGIYAISNSNPVISYTTVADNVAVYLTGGVYSSYSSKLEFYNSIIWNNSLYQFRLGNCQLTIDHCNVMGGVDSIYMAGTGSLNWLEGNIDEDPGFLAMGGHPYMLSAGSPCIDACGPSTVPAQKIYPWDLAGNPRCVDGDGDDTVRTDMGPYEFQGPADDYFTGIPGISSQDFECELGCYPNPVRDQAHITFSVPQISSVCIEVYDASGMKVQTLEQSRLPAGEHRLGWDVKGLSPGIYMLRISAGNNTGSKKVIVCR